MVGSLLPPHSRRSCKHYQPTLHADDKTGRQSLLNKLAMPENIYRLTKMLVSKVPVTTV